MLKQISLENFKPFNNEQVAELKPITLIYGPNSSGKSSLIQSLLLLTQSLKPQGGSNLVPRGELVDLGSFQSLIHQHDSAKSLKIGITFTTSGRYLGPFNRELHEGPLKIVLTYKAVHGEVAGSYMPAQLEEVSYGLLDSGETIRFLRSQNQKLKDTYSHTGYFDEENTVLYNFADEKSVNTVEEWVNRDPHLRRRFSSLSSRVKETEDTESRFEYVKNALEGNTSESRRLKQKIKQGKFKPSTKLQYKQKLIKLDKEKIVLKSLSKDLNELLTAYKNKRRNFEKNIKSTGRKNTVKDLLDGSLVGSGFLPLPERLIFKDVDGPVPGFIPRQFDEFSMNLFYELQSIRYLGPLRSYPERHYLLTGAGVQSVGKTGENTPHILYEHQGEIKKSVNHWVDKFAIPYELDINLKSFDEVMGDVLTISLKDRNTDIRVSPSDVGFGIGQLLPIIVEGLFSRGNIICVE